MDTRLTQLPDHPDATEPEPFAGPDNPMRMMTRAKAFGDSWEPSDSSRVQEIFDGMAASWSETHVDPIKAAPVEDALERGRVPLDRQWLEIGSGTGAGARILRDRVDSLVCTDLAAEMLRHAPDIAPMVRADASQMPFPDHSFDVILLINMLLFPAEVDRLLRSGGSVLWVNTLGDQTPIHLPPGDVLEAMPGAWTGSTARAGTGFWLTARRA
jgi:predicted TPR repeat methyltransferase